MQRVVTIGSLGDVGDDTTDDTTDDGSYDDTTTDDGSSDGTSYDTSSSASGSSSGGLALYQRSAVALAATGALVVAFVVARLVKDR